VCVCVSMCVRVCASRRMNVRASVCVHSSQCCVRVCDIPGMLPPTHHHSLALSPNSLSPKYTLNELNVHGISHSNS
jgi:hypothetical protein